VSGVLKRDFNRVSSRVYGLLQVGFALLEFSSGFQMSMDLQNDVLTGLWTSKMMF
jgi:hypothetical protein